ncbi:MAG: putative ATPase/class 3 adenylate cyclase [Parasphingorhabdus sp.]|jgi:predicted ATPase/class 3 adenylate cyclase
MSKEPIVTLPDGTVTLMLTDVEGSTVLWEEAPDAMASAIHRHYELMDAAISQHNGVRPVEQGEGDSAVAAFRSTTDAIACGLEVQRTFAAESWLVSTPVKVRMAIHTGQVLLRDSGNYFGPTIIRCARLRSLACGGQILVSNTTRTIVTDLLPSEIEILDLGIQWLKGLDHPEHVWQLTHPDIANEFPPLHTESNIPTNLPSQLSSFVGREHDLNSIHQTLTSNRLVTLIGSGGCGKTRLALQIGADELDKFVDGVWYIELAPIANTDLVAHAIAGVFGLREELGRPMVDTLVDQLKGFKTLLIVDNCEQVLTGVAKTLQQLLEHCPQLRVLATSRESLGLIGESTWQVASLEGSTAVELFVQRAQSLVEGFIPTDDEINIITNIVERLDGIPLAIELAAARVRMMSPARIAVAIDDRFRLLTGGNRTAMARQKTLEASVKWSYDLLDEEEKLLACRLAIMHSFTLEAAEDIASNENFDRYAVLDGLTGLVDKSMVQVDHSRPGNSYRFLETIRQYLQGLLIESGELEQVYDRHLNHFVELAERCAPVISFRDSAQLLTMLEYEHDNLETALKFADESGRRELALRLATALTLFWELRGHLGRAGRWFARLLEQPDTEPSKFRARACWGAAHIALYGGDIATMTVRAPEALELAEKVDDDWARARALNTVGFATAVFTPAQARPGLMRSVELGGRSNDDWSVVDSWKMISVSHWVEHDDAGAAIALETMHAIATRLEAGYFLAWYHGLVGFFLAHRGELAEARTHLNTSIEICDMIGEPVTGGLARCWLMSIDISQGNFDIAHEEATSMLQHASASGSGLAISEAMARLGEIAIARGDAPGAVVLLTPFVEAERLSGIPYFVVVSALVLASAQHRTGNLAGATTLLDNMAEVIDGFGNDWMMARLQLQRALIALKVGEFDKASELVQSSLATFIRMGQRPDLAPVLDVLGFLATARHNEIEAVSHFSTALALRSRLEIVAWSPDAMEVNDACDNLRTALGQEIFTRHWNEGAMRTVDEVIEYVSHIHAEEKN